MRTLLPVVTLSLLAIAGCSSSSSSANSVSGGTLSVSLTPGVLTIPSDGSTVSIVVSAARPSGDSNAITLSVTGLPASVTTSITQPGTGSFGTIFFTSTGATSGSFNATVTASEGAASATTTLAATVSAADAITITPAATAVTAWQNATPATTPLSFTRSFGNAASISVSASGLPTGLTATFTQPGSATTGSVSFTTSSTPAAAGVYSITLTATDGKASATATVNVTVGVVLTVTNAVDTTQGLSGHFQEFLTTGFQPSQYNNSWFVNNPSTADLAALKPTHIRLQPVVGALPWIANSSPQSSTDWSFTGLDQTVQPVLGVGDQSPIFQIAKAPGFLTDSNGYFVYNSTNLSLLASYAANLVRYYNTGGFTWGGKHFQSASSTPIKWWAIFNEPNLNNITPAQYVGIYNTVVPAMLAVDPTIKFLAVELSDYSGQPQAVLPTLVQPATSGGLSAQVNAFSTHFYGTCKQATTDASLFSGISQFTSDVAYFRSEMALRSDLAGLPVWITENNVNSDYQLTTGYSSCTPTQLYVIDLRESSPFFTAYRPLLFSKFGKAGAQALYHFLYEGTLAYGEVNSKDASKTFAYWTDYTLEHAFPAVSDGTSGASTSPLVLRAANTETTPDIEVLAVQNADNSVSLMIANYAVASSTDNNGAGTARSVQLNLSGFGTFSKVTETDLNAGTSLSTGPAAYSITSAGTFTFNFTGYGTTFLTLKP